MSEQRDEAADLAMCEAAEPAPWLFGVVDGDFVYAGPQWGAGDLVEHERHEKASEGDWALIVADAKFVAMARTALPHYIHALRSERERRKLCEAGLKKLACLGNGDQWGNSDGNRIAQSALVAQAALSSDP